MDIRTILKQVSKFKLNIWNSANWYIWYDFSHTTCIYVVVPMAGGPRLKASLLFRVGRIVPTDLTDQTLSSNLHNSPNYLKLTSNLRRTNAINKPTWKLTSLTIWNFPFHLNQISSQTSLANLTSLVMHVYGMFTARLLLTQLLVVLIVLMSNAGSSEEAMHA